MQIFIFKSRWSPYLAGTLAGLLAVASVVVSTKYLGQAKYLGASTSFVRAAGMVESHFQPERVAKNNYYHKTGTKVDWQMMFLAGIFFGALLSSIAGGTFRFEAVPVIWSEFLGSGIIKRAFFAFIGGAVALYGARMAGGCPSGHGLSGMMQLALSGFVAMAAFMLGGIITANLIYKRSW
jgi:uncharacterized protein